MTFSITKLAMSFLLCFALLVSQAKAATNSLRGLQTMSCPKPDPGVPVTADLNPVRCGRDYKCYYDNTSIAHAAGFNVNYCKAATDFCPPPGNNLCPSVSDPVLCGRDELCEYASECLANAAGFVGCRRVNKGPESCPPPGSSHNCGNYHQPVKCGSQYHCQYMNQCFASAAGFTNGCISA